MFIVLCFLSLFSVSSIVSPSLTNNDVKIKHNLNGDSSVLMMNNSDFTSTDFLFKYVEGINSLGGNYQNINFGILSNYTYSVEAPSGTYSIISTLNNGWIDLTNYVTINKIILDKVYLGSGTNSDIGTFYNFTYTLFMYTSSGGTDTLRLQIPYNVISYNSYIMLPQVYINYSSITVYNQNGNYAYYEDTNSNGSLSMGWLPLHDVYYQQYMTLYDDEYSYNKGYSDGYDVGNYEGYEQGIERGKEISLDPNSSIYQTIYNNGYQIGRTDGIEEASASDGVPALIFSGVLNVALIPVNIFLQMFQYEVFGINIAGLISGILTVAMVIIIIRFILGGKNSD